MYILTNLDTDSNESKLDKDSRAAVFIAMIATMVGFLFNSLQVCATRADTGEDELRVQFVHVIRPNRDLRKLTETIARRFGSTVNHFILV